MTPKPNGPVVLNDLSGQREQGGQGGQSTAELALVLPVLVILMLAVVQVGLVARDYVAVQHAVRESARKAALDPTAGTAVSAATSASTSLDPGQMSVSLRGGRASADLLTVDLDYRSRTEVPIVGLIIGDVPLTATAVVRVE